MPFFGARLGGAQHPEGGQHGGQVLQRQQQQYRFHRERAVMGQQVHAGQVGQRYRQVQPLHAHRLARGLGYLVYGLPQLLLEERGGEGQQDDATALAYPHTAHDGVRQQQRHRRGGDKELNCQPQQVEGVIAQRPFGLGNEGVESVGSAQAKLPSRNISRP